MDGFLEFFCPLPKVVDVSEDKEGDYGGDYHQDGQKWISENDRNTEDARGKGESIVEVSCVLPDPVFGVDRRDRLG